MSRFDDLKKCCLCGKAYRGWGNNPRPVDNTPDARCCDTCNVTKVIPARLFGESKESK